MPTVRITAKLGRQIEAKIDALVVKQKTELPNFSKEESKQFALHIANHLNLQDPLYNDYFLNITGIFFKCSSSSFLAECSGIKMMVPYGLNYSPAYGSNATLEITENMFADNNMLSEKFIKLRNRRNQYLETIDKFHDTATALVKRCTTMKQLLEAWPQIEKFIPEDALKKHYAEEKKQRKKGVYLEDEQKNVLNEMLIVSKLDS